MKERVRVNRKTATSPQSPRAMKTEAAETRAIEDAVQSGGHSLDTSVQSDMGARFGHDFSRVRVHTDDDASASAQSLNASAYTLGQDIVFRQGEYAPDSVRGQHLLAHELTHVIQQDAAPSTNSTLQRSTAGAIVGGAIGGVAGFLLGGPLGAAAGAGIGAASGDSISTTNRQLSGDEVTYAQTIYLNSLDYGSITISRGSAASVGGTARTLGNTINMDDDEFVGDTMELSPAGRETLIHEMAHVWQYQHNGWSYAPEALWAQAKAAWQTGSRNGAYDWRSLDRAGTPWEQWNPEAQAEAVEDYNKALRRAFDGSASNEDYKDLDRLGQYIVKMQGEPTPPGDYEQAPPPSGPGSALA